MGAYLKAKRARTDMGANTHAEGHPDPRESPLNVRQQAALRGRRVGTESGLKATAKGSDRRPDGGGPDDVTFRFSMVVATGEEGHHIRAAQARAIKELLLWLHRRHCQDETTG